MTKPKMKPKMIRSDRIEGVVEAELPGGVEVAQMRVRFEMVCSDGRVRSIDSIVDRDDWNAWTQAERREYIVAALRSTIANLEIGDVP